MRDLTDRVRDIRDRLTTGLVERDVAIRLALLAALSGEHLLLIGPPGTAKSLVARRLRLAFKDADYFERLLTRFSVPEELFGPLSIKGLEEDRYERLTESYLPAASIAFLDEIFKANSAILNALLTLLNEREFDNGTRRERTPLMAVVGASNELPEGEELDALFDRFLLRLHVGPVSKDGFLDLLKLRGDAAPDVPDALKLTRDDLDTVQKAAGDVRVPDDVVALLCDLREWCAAEDITVSDRRWRKVVRLLQTSALTNGRETVSIWDCWLLQHCLWSDAEDRMKIYDWYASRVGAAAEEPAQLVRIVNAWEGKLEKDKGRRSLKSSPKTKETRYVEEMQALEQAHEQARKEREAYQKALSAAMPMSEAEYKEFIQKYIGSVTGVERDHLGRSKPIKENSPSSEPTKHKSDYIEHSIAELDDLRIEMESYKKKINQRIESLEDDIRSHLWVTDDFIEPASKGLDKTRADVDKLLGRLAEVVKGFEELSRKEEALLREEKRPFWSR